MDITWRVPWYLCNNNADEYNTCLLIQVLYQISNIVHIIWLLSVIGCFWIINVNGFSLLRRQLLMYMLLKKPTKQFYPFFPVLSTSADILYFVLWDSVPFIKMYILLWPSYTVKSNMKKWFTVQNIYKISCCRLKPVSG